MLTGTRRDGLFFSPVDCDEILKALVYGEECFDGTFRPEE